MEKGKPRLPRVYLLRNGLCQGSRIDMVYADIYTDLKLANKTKIIHIMVSLLIIIILFLLTDSPQKLKLEKIHEALTILFYVSPA